MADLILGVQWGDEGKGKIVDALAKDYDYIVRANGGSNAGHTIVADGKKISTHLIPSGILYDSCKNVIGSGVVFDADILKQELSEIIADVRLEDRLFISENAHIVLNIYKELDAAKDKIQGIGTTKRGIGISYAMKCLRDGIRVRDLRSPNLSKKLENIINFIAPILKEAKLKVPDIGKLEKELLSHRKFLDEYTTNTTELLWKAQDDDKRILLEGAQGSMLDIDYGTYPYVTSSNTLSSGLIHGSGLNIKDSEKIIGVAKAYCTRVGNGVFPTEDFGSDGDKLRDNGFEYGATTGRPRRCGWIDVVALRYAVRLNGCTEIALMKLDVLDKFEEVKVCTHYEINGEIYDTYDGETENVKPVYKIYKGWKKTLSARNYDDLPEEAKDYVEDLEELIGCKISIISTSPNREDLIHR